jgi:nucleotide-binding universal stress UspA family protein
MFGKILCPTDFSDNSIAALEQAAKLARKSGSLLYLMHVEFIPLRSPAELNKYVEVSTEPGKLRLQEIARKHLAGVKHELVLRVGWPAEVIDKAAADLDVDLIVMATHGREGVARLFLGSIAEHVVRTSARPVLSFGPGASLGTLKRILCPVDFDPRSLAALKFGWRIAQEYGATLSVLHVVRAPFEPSEVPAEPAASEWEQDAHALLAKAAADNLGSKAGCKLLVRRGNPAAAIFEVEKELRPSLIVMATHGRIGLSHMLLGSVAERIVRESTIPVMTVPRQHSVA